MNILLQLYACDPHQGGEFTVSWGWLVTLDSIMKAEDMIYVCSGTLQQQDILSYDLKHVQIINVPVEKIQYAKKTMFYYIMWQREAYKAAKNLNIRFDYVHVFFIVGFQNAGGILEI